MSEDLVRFAYSLSQPLSVSSLSSSSLPSLLHLLLTASYNSFPVFFKVAPFAHPAGATEEICCEDGFITAVKGAAVR